MGLSAKGHNDEILKNIGIAAWGTATTSRTEGEYPRKKQT